MEIENDNSLVRGIRKEFFAFRNGIVADKLRKAGDPHTMIMGCLLTDLVGIAQRTRATVNDEVTLAATAQELWDDTKSRECRLTAPMLYPTPLMTAETALNWSMTVETIEVADNLCHKLLRHLQDANSVMHQLIAQKNTLVKYTGYRLMLNLLLLKKLQPTASLKDVVEGEKANATPPLTTLLRDILEELDEQD